MKREEVSFRVGKKIRELRRKKEYTIEKLAVAASIDYTQLSRIELGKINTSIYQLYRIAKTIDVPICSFLEDLE